MNNKIKNKKFLSIGLMSGTAMDGIDAALIRTDGMGFVEPLGYVEQPHNQAFKTSLKSCLNLTDRNSPKVKALEREFTLAQISVINELLCKTGYDAVDVDIIGFHGQTIHHDFSKQLTIQLGDGQLLANKTNINVVYNFRQADMQNGGHGAPLIPVYHHALANKLQLTWPVAFVNIGGVANISWLDNEISNIVGFDTGPGNALIDDWVKKNANLNYDKNGEIATKGVIDKTILNKFMALNYFNLPYPKSLDRNDFSTISLSGLSLEDGAATLMEVTVKAINIAINKCPSLPNHIYITGGGRLNLALMNRLNQVTNLPVSNIDTLNLNGDSMEAEGFAYMAVRKLINQPITFPKTTGCQTPVIGGEIVFTSQTKCLG